MLLPLQKRDIWLYTDIGKWVAVVSWEVESAQCIDVMMSRHHNSIYACPSTGVQEIGETQGHKVALKRSKLTWGCFSFKGPKSYPSTPLPYPHPYLSTKFLNFYFGGIYPTSTHFTQSRALIHTSTRGIDDDAHQQSALCTLAPPLTAPTFHVVHSSLYTMAHTNCSVGQKQSQRSKLLDHGAVCPSKRLCFVGAMS